MSPKERARLQRLLVFEKALWRQGVQLIAGIDEAGRGPLAGPVVAAACMIPPKMMIKGVNDSKQLTRLVRQKLYQTLTSSPDIQYGVGVVDVETIDQINILQATIQAMLQALEKMPVKPQYLLVDGKPLKAFSTPSQSIVEGDARSQSIAAASVIAKEVRDLLMEDLHKRWPQYGFDQHKGYSTREHLRALREHGPSPVHRRSFAPVRLAHPDLFGA